MKRKKTKSKLPVKVMQNVVAIIFTKNKEYKFLVLKKTGTWEGWQFMQGSKEADESLEDAVHREVEEETGIKDIAIVKKLPYKADYWFVWEGERIHKFQTFFLVKVDKEHRAELSKEHDEAQWVSGEKALEMIKFNKDIFAKVLKDMHKLK